MAVKTGTFNGANVFLSRNLVPPEMFDALHDALRLNGAHVFLCCDPSRNSPSDYHVISSPDHEKFEDLRTKGCNLLGPHCVLSCAKERRSLPKQAYTCCLAMDGVKVLASGFEKDEKVKIEELVTAMGGALVTKAALDVSFVIAKHVLTAKYKWALYVLKKPIVGLSWLRQCWAEHRLVPQESYRILPFTGLTICVTRVPADEREEMRKLMIQNGGKYSADLTKKCTHLISDPFHKAIYAILDISHAPEGDKYMVAKKWGNIHIVSRKWFDQSTVRKARLDEGRYPVHRGSIPCNSIQNSMKEQYSQSQSNRTSQPLPSTDCPDVDITMSQNLSSTFSDGNNIKSQDNDVPVMPSKGEPKVDGNVAEDSEEDNDLYLSSCRILLVGFVEKELRRLVSMIRRGGGSRHMSLSEKLTHIIVGTASDNEKKEVRRLAAWGVINVVKTAWLEDCDLMKKEVPVSQRHVACDLLLKDTTSSRTAGTSEIKNLKNLTALPSMPTSEMHFDKSDKELSLLSRSMGTETFQVIPQETNVSYITTRSTLGNKLKSVHAEDNDNCRLLSNSNSSGTQRQATHVFKGLSFSFSGSFPKDKRAEIEEWVIQGGGLMTTNHGNVNFIIECHGLIQKLSDPCPATMVSSHWIRFCLEEGCLLDVGSHVLFSPLRCHIPLSGYRSIRFCISQYEDKERVLLKNLCFTLGAKFTEKLTKRVTHLLCKFANGPKYEAACNWGIESVTAEWINECIRQDMMAAMDQFRPKVVTTLDRETGLCITSQYPTQAACTTSIDASSQLLNESILCATKQTIGIKSDRYSEVPDFSGALNKRQKYSENGNIDDGFPKANLVEDMKRGSNSVSDVADVIEDLLAQSNKDTRTTEENGCHQSIYSPGHFIIGQDHTNSSSSFQISDHRLNRFDKQFSTSSPAADKNPATFDAFSETQTESQVVWYEEDLSGRQKIIERVRSQSMTLTPEPK